MSDSNAVPVPHSHNPKIPTIEETADTRMSIGVSGFRFAGVCAGLKPSGKADIALISSARSAQRQSPHNFMSHPKQGLCCCRIVHHQSFSGRSGIGLPAGASGRSNWHPRHCIQQRPGQRLHRQGRAGGRPEDEDGTELWKGRLVISSWFGAIR